jgi:O-antigen/teichoic acid export membrane protein
MTFGVARNTLFLLTVQVLDKAASYLFLVYVTRLFGSEFFGTYITAVTFVIMAGYLVDFGLFNLVVRDLAQDRSRVQEYLGRVLPLRAGLAAAAIALIQVAARAFGYPSEVAFLAGIASLSLLIGAPGALLMAGMNALEQIHISALCSMAGNLLTTAFSILALHAGMGLPGVFLGWLAAGAVSLVLVFAGAKRVGVGMSPRFDWGFLRRTVGKALPFATLSLALMASSLDVLILSRWHGAEAAGLYGAARRPLEILLFIPNSLMGALYPVLAAQYASSGERLWQTYQESLYFLTCLAMPLAIGVTMLRERIILLLFGKAFLPAADAVPYLAFALAIAFLSSPATHLIFSAHRTVQFVPYFVGNAMGGILLNLLLIPRFAYVGASVATLMTILTGFFVQRHFVALIFGKIPAFATQSLRPLLAAGLMAVVLHLFWSFGTVPLVGIGGATYAAALWALGGHRREAFATSGK